ncbi:hypothetical protein AB0L05_27915 [Nonomuraea pusilla]|uniref:recombination directionality factor n=1 Tax=Nonomuraea pusilla TaxID=46177 RepID=UPI0033243ECE
MGARIITLQRQARELGRLRTGYSVPNDDPSKRNRAVRSQTWIISSHAEHYVEAAAEIWGGQVEKWQPQGNGAPQWRVITQAASLDAILPPGDPLSQSYELWSAGGAQRRCDGMTESLSDSPCLCRAQWGDAFHETAPRDRACKMTTRLNVILPEMPDIGAWRVETHSYHAANEIAAAVDVLKGSIGMDALIPVRLRIEQRTRVAQGKTKQFPVVAVELRGGTAGQVLAGAVQAPAVGSAARPAVEAARTDYVELIKAAASRDQVVKIWEQAKQDPHADGKQVEAAAKARVAALKTAASTNPMDEAQAAPAGGSALAQAAASEMASMPNPVQEAYDAAHQQGSTPGASDADMLWQAIVARWPRGMTELAKTFQGAMGVQHQVASKSELAAFLKILTSGKYDDPVPTKTAVGAEEEVPF